MNLMRYTDDIIDELEVASTAQENRGAAAAAADYATYVGGVNRAVRDGHSGFINTARALEYKGIRDAEAPAYDEYEMAWAFWEADPDQSSGEQVVESAMRIYTILQSQIGTLSDDLSLVGMTALLIYMEAIDNAVNNT